jgi:hypothetical protein
VDRRISKKETPAKVEPLKKPNLSWQPQASAAVFTPKTTPSFANDDTDDLANYFQSLMAPSKGETTVRLLLICSFKF